MTRYLDDAEQAKCLPGDRWVNTKEAARLIGWSPISRAHSSQLLVLANRGLIEHRADYADSGAAWRHWWRGIA